MKWRKRKPDQPEHIGLTPGQQAQLARALGLRDIQKIVGVAEIMCNDCEERVAKTGRHQFRCKKCAKLRRQYLKGVYQKGLMKSKRRRPETMLALVEAAYAPRWALERLEIEQQILAKVRALKVRSFRQKVYLCEQMLQDHRKQHGPLPLDEDYWPPSWLPRKQLLRILRGSWSSTKRLTK